METKTIENLTLTELTAHPQNARTHAKSQVEQIAKSITLFGWTNPLLVTEQGLILAGHGRFEAAKLLGLETVPCLRIIGLSDEQARAYVIADNKIALNSGWDEELLAKELEALKQSGLDLESTGFTLDEVNNLLVPGSTETPPDEFKPVGEDISTDYQCPKCSFAWSGKAKS